MNSFPETAYPRSASAEKPANNWSKFDHASPNYLVDAPSFFIPAWEQHLDLMQHLTHYGKVLLAVMGEQGSGKTTLLRQMMLQTRETAQAYAVNAEENFDLKRLSYCLLQAFNVAAHLDGQDLEDVLFDQVAQLQQRVNPSLLLIDNAEKLPVKTLATLLRLTEQGGDGPVGLRIALFGSPKLFKHLNSLNNEFPLQEITHVIELESLDLDETEDYLRFYLQQTAHKGVFPFTATQVERIWQESLGLPGRINEIAQDYLAHMPLRHGGLSMQVIATLRSHASKLIGAGVLAGLLIVLLIFQNQLGSVIRPNKQKAKANETTVTLVNPQFEEQPNVRDQIVKRTPYVPDNTVFEAQALNNDQGSTATTNAVPAQPTPAPIPAAITPIQNKTATALPALQPEPAAPTVATVPNNAAVAEANNALPLTTAEVKKPAKQQPTVDNKVIPGSYEAMNAAANATVQPAAQVVKPTAQIAKAKSPSAPNKQNARASNMEKNNKVAHLPAAAGIADRKKDKLAKVKPETATVAVSKAKDKVASASITPNLAPTVATGQRFTLQLISLSDETRAKDFIKSHNLSSAQYFKTKINNQDLYVIVNGDYATEAEAFAAARQLRDKYADVNPWVRLKR